MGARLPPGGRGRGSSTAAQTSCVSQAATAPGPAEGERSRRCCWPAASAAPALRPSCWPATPLRASLTGGDERAQAALPLALALAAATQSRRLLGLLSPPLPRVTAALAHLQLASSDRSPQRSARCSSSSSSSTLPLLLLTRVEVAGGAWACSGGSLGVASLPLPPWPPLPRWPRRPPCLPALPQGAAALAAGGGPPRPQNPTPSRPCEDRSPSRARGPRS